MATFTLNGIQFTATEAPQQLPDKYGNGDNGDFADAGTDGVEPFINAVEIDWNGAVLPQSNISNGGSLTINNTGDLLNLVNEIICIKCSPRVVNQVI